MAEGKQNLREWLGRDHGTIALVFTDIVDSTGILLSMSEEQWIEMLRRHFERARLYLKQNNGFEVKLIGDACMVAFPTAEDAMRFAVSFFNDTGDSLIAIKAGIHFGSAHVFEEDDIYGVMVHLTSRIQHALKQSGIAMSRAVRHELKSLGPSLGGWGEVISVQHDGLQGFDPEDQEVFQIRTPDLRVRHQKERREKEERRLAALRRRRIARQIDPKLPESTSAEKIRPTPSASTPIEQIRPNVSFKEYFAKKLREKS